MKRLFIIIFIFLFFGSLFISCESIIKDNKTYNHIDATNALSKLVPAFNEVLRDNAGFISIIKEEADKRFDGTTDVLFDTIKNRSLVKGGKTFKELLNSKLISKGSSESLEDLISKIPYFNIYVFTPEVKSLNKENEENIIVVADRYDVDGMSYEYIIYCIDMLGNEYQFAKGQEPDKTTFVLGVNEALAYEAYLNWLSENGRNQQQATPNILTTTKGGWDQKISREFQITQLYLYNNYEFFPKGPAEIYMLVVYAKYGINSGIRVELTEVDDEKWVYNMNRNLVTLINESYESKFAVYFREWDIFWFWESGTYPDQVIAHLTIETVTPTHIVSYAFGCNRWDDDLRYAYQDSFNNGHVYDMPECVSIADHKFAYNGFKVDFWESISGTKFYFGMPNATSNYYNWANITFKQY